MKIQIKHNFIIKSLGLICSLVFIFLLLLLSQRDKTWIGIGILLTYFIWIGVPICIILLTFSAFRFRKLDKIDKIFSVIALSFLVVSAFVYSFFSEIFTNW